MPDPKLKQAMDEITKTLRRFDIAGSVVLVSKTHAEYRYQFPTWSVLQLETGPNGEPGLRIRSAEANYPSKAEQKQALEESLHCGYQIRDIAGQTFLMFDTLLQGLMDRAGFEVEHRPFSGFEPHQEDE